MSVQREWFEKDYYAILGVPSNASQKEITAAYRKLARQLHPDANPGDSAAEERFKAVSAAYDVIGDPERRKEYDQVRSLGPMAGAGGTGGGAWPGGARFDPADLGDLLGNLFGRGEDAGYNPAGPFSRGPQRGADLEADLHLSFIDSIQGVTTSVNLVSEVSCPDCSGSGAAQGTSPRVCPDCNGRGVLDDNQGFFSFSRPCTNCGGRGVFIDTPCATCSGSGATTRPRLVRVRIPAGVRDRQAIRLKGKGAPGRNNGPSGDLYVRVHVEAHSVFGRDGDNLTVTVPITFPEAALGADVKVPTIEGDSVTIRIPPGTPSGRIFRVRERGVAAASSRDGARGDLLVTVELTVPTTLTDAERHAVEALRDSMSGSPREGLGV
ncbi:MAG TPA: molecular chaperone DnaJ [Microthrixaceae bacterium]|nr:molecular chaperone DnaJ [Microthrixaceae bacterium]